MQAIDTTISKSHCRLSLIVERLNRCYVVCFFFLLYLYLYLFTVRRSLEHRDNSLVVGSLWVLGVREKMIASPAKWIWVMSMKGILL